MSMAPTQNRCSRQPPPLRIGRAIDGLGPEQAAQELVPHHGQRGGEQHLPVPVEGQEGQRAEDVEVRLDAAAREVDEQPRPEHLADGHPMPREGRARPQPHQRHGKDGQHPAEGQRHEQLALHPARMALRRLGREQHRDDDGHQPLAHHQPGQEAIHPAPHRFLVLGEEPGGALLTLSHRVRHHHPETHLTSLASAPPAPT